MLDKVALCYGQMNEPPGARLRVGLSGLTMAEYFRDQGQDVLLFIDNIFRFVQAGSEVSALLGPHAERRRLPADARHRDGPAAGAHHLDDQGRGHLGAGDLRARRRPDRPGAGATRSPTSTRRPSLVRAIVEQGIYPAVDPLDSTSRALQPGIVSADHYRDRDARAGGAAALQGPAGHHRDPRHRGAVGRRPPDGARARKIQRFLSQPNFVAEQFTGTPGQYVKLEDTIRGFERDPRRPARRAARAGVLHGRPDRGSRRAGAADGAAA